MKRILLSLFIVFGFQLSNAQMADFQVRKYRTTLRLENASSRTRALHLDQLNKSKQGLADKMHKKGAVQKLDYKIDEVWDSAGAKWMNLEKTAYSYDTSGKLLSDLFLVWDFTEWLNDYKTDFTYDGLDNRILILYQLWEPSSEVWDKIGKDENTFDGSNNKTSSVYSEWDIAKSVWNKTTKNEYTYDAAKNILSDIYLEWNATTSLWVNFDKFEYTYDGSGKLLKDAYFVWNKLTSKWDNNDKFDFTYNGKDNVFTKIFQEWLAGIWVNSNKETFTYDAQDRTATMVYTVWDKIKSLWVNNQKDDYTYDAASNECISIRSVWIARDSNWDNSQKDESTYDLTKKIEDVVWPYMEEFEEVNFKNKPTQLLSFEWLTGNSTWQNDLRLTYYYSAFGTTGLNDQLLNSIISAFPNPASGIININGIEVSEYEIRIFDSFGKLVKISNQIGNAQMDVSDLRSGLYLLQFNAGNYQLGQKKVAVY